MLSYESGVRLASRQRSLSLPGLGPGPVGSYSFEIVQDTGTAGASCEIRREDG